MKGCVASIVVVAGVAIVGFFAGREHDDRLWNNAHRVKSGMSTQQAEHILGRPSWHDKCEAKFPYGSDNRCRTELGYRSAFAPFPPIYLVVQIDSQGRVISIDTINSP